MKQFLSDLWKKVKHNQFLVVGFCLSLGLVLWAYGCESSVQSIIHPQLKVTRAELGIEVDTLIAQAENRFKSLDKQDQFKNALFELAIAYMEGGNVNPVGVVVSLVGILGLGAVVDNRRKDVRINSLKSEIENGKENT